MLKIVKYSLITLLTILIFSSPESGEITTLELDITEEVAFIPQMLSTPTPISLNIPKEDKPMVQYFGSGASYILNSNDNKTIAFTAANLLEPIPVIIETYRLTDTKKLEQQGFVYRDYDVPLSLLERTDTNVFLLENGNNYFSLNHQGDGAYIVAVTYTDPLTKEESHHRASYMITPLSVYKQASNRDTLVWITSSQTGKGVRGLALHFGDENSPTATTDQNGLAYFDRGSDLENDECYFRIYNQNGELVYFDDGVSQTGFGLRERYYSYLFLDRTIYRPEDTINFWGVIKPYRNNEREMPGTVRITFDANGLNMVQEIPLSPDGIFSGTFELDRIRSAQYSIQMSIHFPPDEDDEEESLDGTHMVLETRHFSVRDFQKPAYTIDSSVDLNYYFPEDNVTVTARIAFYDGTPLPNKEVEVSYYDAGKREWIGLKNVETDVNGNITFSFPAWASSWFVSGGITINRYRIRVVSDGEDITHIGNYNVFPSDILIDTRMERQADGENISLIIETFLLDKDSEAFKAEMENEIYWLDNNRLLQIAKGDPVSVEDLKISFYWNFFDQNNENQRHNYWRWDSYYDENKNLEWRRMLFNPDYNYNYIVENNPDLPIRSITDLLSGEKLLELSTLDGSVTINGILFIGETDIDWELPVYAQAVIKFADSFGNNRTSWGYYPNFLDYYEDWSSTPRTDIVKGYSLAARNLTDGTHLRTQVGNYNGLHVDVGDTLRFELMFDEEPTGSGGSILYSLVQDGVIQYRIVPGNRFDLKYILDYGPNLNLAVVYFDGQNIHPVSQTRISVSSLSMQMNVEVTPDKEIYAPGDTVRFSVRTTDRKGNGIPANICIAVVDESVFAISEQYIYLWEDFFDDVRFTYNGIWQYFTVWRGDPPELHRDTNGKDGNSTLVFYDNFRSNFKDTAAFLKASTNSAGYANLSFKLPDNNTSWRMTSVAVAKNNLLTGQARDNFISTLPFFVRPVVNTKYIEGDDIAMLVGANGIVLDAESTVSFVVNLSGDNINETISFDGKAYESHELNFNKLPSGSYTLTFQARFGSHIDTIVLPISVIKSNLELVISKEVDLSQKLEIEASRYPVTLTFYDDNVQPFITSLNSLFGHYCMQTNQRMSRVVAKQALRDTMPGVKVPSYIAQTDDNIADMQNVDGGIGSAIGNPSDPRLTTYILMASTTDQFDLRAMAEYFKGVLGQSGFVNKMTAALCHLGLAAIKDETISVELLKAELEKASDLEIKAHYIAAIASLGDMETALTLYNQYCAPYMKRPDNEQTTAAVWIAATLLGHEDADKIALYFGKMSWRINTLYECMIYVRHFDKIVESSAFSYTIGGKEFNIEFGAITYDRMRGKFMHTKVLSRSDLESLEFADIPENIRATVYYIGEPSEIGLEPSDNMQITKSIRSIDDKTYEVTLRIALKKDTPLGQYDISDWIPTNTRLYDFDTRYEYSNVRYKVRQEMQNLYISFNRTYQEQQTIFYRYRVRQVFESEAVLDTVYMIHGDTGQNANSAKGVFNTKR